MTSTSQIVRLTINPGITSNALLRKQGFVKPTILHNHWRQRIGRYRKIPDDYWWKVDSVDVAENTADEIIDLIETDVFPEWAQLQTTRDLLSIWEKGICPGITEVQRNDYINTLKQTTEMC